MEIPEYVKKELEKAKLAMPEKKKFADRLRRLHNLAKQSPFAAANEDLLELWESKITDLENEVGMFDKIMEAINSGDMGGIIGGEINE